MSECPICGVPAMNGLSGVCDSHYCREKAEMRRKDAAYREECRDWHDNVKTREYVGEE